MSSRLCQLVAGLLAALVLLLWAVGPNGWAGRLLGISPDEAARRPPGAADGQMPGRPGPAQPGGPDPTPLAWPADLEHYLRAALATADGVWGVYVRDLRTLAEAGWHEDRYFPAASTLKLPAVLWAAEAIAAGTLDPDEIMLITDSDREPGTGILHTRPTGEAYAVRILMELAITHSDNTAFAMLLRRLGGRSALLAAMAARGGQPLDQAGTTHLTPRELGHWLLRLWQGEGPAPAERERILTWLQRTRFPDRMAAGVPAGVAVAHKIGTLPDAVHDAGIVLAPGRPYILVIMSQHVPEAEAAERIRLLTRDLHERLTANGG